MRPPKICRYCGATLDWCEECDCREDEETGESSDTGEKKSA